MPRRALVIVLVLLGIHHGAYVVTVMIPRLEALRAPRAYERAIFPDQDALREIVGRASGRVAIPKGAVHWMPRPTYVLHWERNGEIFFDRLEHRQTPPGRVLEVLARQGVTSLALDVKPPLPRGGRVGHRTVDAWIRAVRRPDPNPPAARGGRVWVLVDLLPAMINVEN